MFQNLSRVMETVSKEKNIPKEKLIEVVEAAILSAARKKFGKFGELEARFDPEKGEVELFQFKTVVENVVDPNIELSIKEAHAMDPEAQPGDSLGVKMEAKFGRIAAQAAKQIIMQKLLDAEREIIFDEFKDRVGELITGVVRRQEKNGDIIVDIGRAETILQKKEQVPGEFYKNGERVQGYFLELGRGSHQIVLSRSHPMFVRRLFEMEVPEVREGIVDIKNVAREPGARTKIAVYSKDSDVDPVGACVGMKGSRVQSIVQEMRGEKIDIVQWDQDPARFVCNAVAPADVSRVIIREKEHKMEVIVPDDQLSLAIGKKGQNVRLAAQLTGWDLDVLSETKIEEFATRHKKALVKILNVDDSTAFILYGHGYRTVEDIAKTGKDEFFQMPGLGKANLENMYEIAAKMVESGVTTASIIAETVEAEKAEKAKEAEEAEKAKEAEEAEKAKEVTVDENAVKDDKTN